uniref:Uncharacterized protein n=1 Tax=Arundo donax TaxID=35708 RepID=A0A0A8ZG43_ARUDO
MSIFHMKHICTSRSKGNSAVENADKHNNIPIAEEKKYMNCSTKTILYQI